MTEDHWKAIIDGAALFISKQKAPMKQEESVEVEMDDEEEEDALDDPMFHIWIWGYLLSVCGPVIAGTQQSKWILIKFCDILS